MDKAIDRVSVVPPFDAAAEYNVFVESPHAQLPMNQIKKAR